MSLKLDGSFELGTYVIVRSNGSGVFAGTLVGRDLKHNTATLVNARRLYYWKGAASISQLSVDGVSCPNECKFPCEVTKVEITNVLEILEVSDKAKQSIASVPVWKA
jgi:hypothetical protein